jgi:hypothetical protein
MTWTPPAYEVDIPTMKELAKDYPAVLKTIKKYLPDLRDDQILKVAGIVLDTCSSCHEAPRGCQCWNDE